MSDKPKDNLAETKNGSIEADDNSSDSPKKSPIKMFNKMSEKDEHALADKIAGRTRFIASVPATGLLIASVVLAIATIINVVISSYCYVIGEMELHELTIDYVEYADSFLLAVALYILSIGLISLFISDNIPLPTWLEFRDFDDLKERLTSVIIVMIGVAFLGHVLKGVQGIDILWLGLGCAAIIAALSVFMRAVFKSEK